MDTDISRLLSPEELTNVRHDLRRDWYMLEIDESRRQLEHIWSPPSTIVINPDMLQLDAKRNPRKHGPILPYIDKQKEHLLYNKATVFYWAQSASQLVHTKGPVILGGI